MSYRLSVKAERDLIDIYRYGVQTFGVSQAEQYNEALYAAFERLSLQPKINRERTEFTRPVRIHKLHAHIIVYADAPDGVLVVRVLHGAQDWPRHL